MNPRELILLLSAVPGGLDQALAFLAMHVCEARLANGREISDAISVREWLEELAEEAKK